MGPRQYINSKDTNYPNQTIPETSDELEIQSAEPLFIEIRPGP